MKSLHLLILLALGAAALFIFAQAPIRVSVEGVSSKNPIPEQYALCKSTENGKSGPGQNTRPTIAWSKAPKGTKSFAIIVSDPDVPSDFADAGKEGKTVPADMPRQLFYHWALVDIPADTTSIPGGPSSQSPAVGKPVKNDLGKYLSNAKRYGGPCPPWNDLRIHHYHFTVYALDVPSLELKANATARDASTAIHEHMITSGELVGTYTLNPSLKH